MARYNQIESHNIIGDKTIIKYADGTTKEINTSDLKKYIPETVKHQIFFKDGQNIEKITEYYSDGRVENLEFKF